MSHKVFLEVVGTQHLCFTVLQALVGAVAEHTRMGKVYHVAPYYDLAHVLLMVLCILATPDCFRSIALRFGKTPGVLHYHYKKIITALSEMADM